MKAPHTTEIESFIQTSLRALVRAEAAGRVPARFTGTGQEIWRTFRNELSAADLVALSIQDAGVAMPVPFDPGHWWPDWPRWATLNRPPAEVEAWIAGALRHADEPRDAFLREQAAVLELDLPSDAAIAALRTPARHERWLELPGSGGWLAYALCARPAAELYYWENFTVVCGAPREMLLAGLIAWELGAPPRVELPIHLDDPDLSATLRAGQTFHAIVGRQDLHGHRDLRILHHTGQGPV